MLCKTNDVMQLKWSMAYEDAAKPFCRFLGPCIYRLFVYTFANEKRICFFVCKFENGKDDIYTDLSPKEYNVCMSLIDQYICCS